MLTFEMRPMAAKKTMLLLSLSCLALVAGCKPGELSLNGTGGGAGLSPFAAPAPVDISVLGKVFAGAMDPTVATRTAALFTNDARYFGQTTNGWSIDQKSGTRLSGLVSNPLKSSGAAFAHVAGLSGANVVIAVSDNNYFPNYQEFTGPFSGPTGQKVTVVNNWQGAFAPNDSPTHGTIVSAVIAGSSNDFVGVAPNAALVFGSYQTDQKLADLGNTAANLGAIAWNNSWGYSKYYVNQSDFDKAFNYGQAGQNYLQALDNFANNGVVVFAVSNDDRDRHSTLMDGLPFVRPSLEAGWIAAANGVPTFSGGNVGSVQMVSSGCNEAARWCLVADGAWKVPDPTLSISPNEPLVTGSSFAAPQISGALALLKQAFPSLSPHELRVRLLASAEDDFFVADATVELATGFNKGYSIKYGHGFLDIEAALKPIGGAAMSLADGGAVSVNAPVLQTGSAFGDAVEMSLAGTDVLVRDALSAGFVMPASALSTGARPGSRALAALSRSLSGNLAHERTATVTALNDPFSSFGGDTMDLSTNDGLVSASVLMPHSSGESVGVNLTRVLTDGPTRVELGLKLAQDNGRILSLDGKDEAKMASVSLGLSQDLGGQGFFAVSGEVGMTDLGGATTLGGAASARFNSAAFQIGSRDVFAKGDRLSLGVAMPMAVSSGQATVNLPVYRETASAGSFEAVELNLAPESRQMDFEIGYQAALSDGLEMKLSVIRSENLGNRANESDQGGAIAFTFSF
jgi:subtilase-type serine protease